MCLARECFQESDDLAELEFIDPLSMQQLAESLANELWSQPPQEQQLEEQNQLHHCTDDRFPSPTGFSFGAIGGNDMATFADGSCTTVGKCFPPLTTGKKGHSGRRASSSVKEHVIAERKRREKMHHQFATLATIIPDITKTDKVSVLGSTIEYVHHLRDRLRTLQEEHHHIAGSRTAAECPQSDPLCCIGSMGDGGKPAENPKIEVDVRGTTILLRVVCREKKGVLIMVLTELEKHGLSIINTNVVPFAELSLNITITAQIEDGISTGTVELPKYSPKAKHHPWKTRFGQI
ncbi:hypothetical protein U9M48_008200 [Paspalum notatum var. saurae]|uniref:BHLH domain-containing protein n=1 Tax=Paspalum notatum var. saurae TaxID=547442 RepID=A0AAQ3WD55_PASNO